MCYGGSAVIYSNLINVLDSEDYLLFLDHSQSNMFIKSKVVILNYSNSKFKFLKKFYYENIYIPLICYFNSISKIIFFGNYPSLFWYRDQNIYFHNIEYLFLSIKPKKLFKTLLFFLTTYIKKPKIFVQSQYILSIFKSICIHNVHVIKFPVNNNLIKCARHLCDIKLIYPTSDYHYKNIKFIINSNDIFKKYNICVYVTVDSDIKMSNVKFIGNLNHENLILLYQKVSGMIFTSKYESFGVPLVEACIYKLPLIAPKLEYVDSIVENYYEYIDDNSLNFEIALKIFKNDLLKSEEKIPHTNMLILPVDFVKDIII